MRARDALPPAAAALLALALYLNTLPGPWLNDDVVEIRDNPRVHTLAGIPSLFVTDFWGGGAGKNPFYRPLVSAANAIIYIRGGGRPAVFHAWNLILHAACSALSVILLLELGLAAPAALAAGLLFAAHPVHTEAVGWISGNAELMASAALLAAWIAHLKGRWMAAAALLALAVLSKETAVVFPGLVVAGDLLRARAPGPGRRARWGAASVYVAVVGGYLAVRYAVLGHLLGGGGQAHGAELLNPLLDEPAATRALTSIKVLGVALRQSLFPRALCLNYGYNQIPIASGPLDPGLLKTVLLVAMAGALLWAAAARRRALVLGAAIFLLAFLPVSNLLFPAISIFAERNIYLPVLGACLAAAALLGGPRWGWGIAAALIAVASFRTVTRNSEFLDPLAYYRAGAAACPDSAGAHNAHGIALREAGRIDEAIAAHERALAIAPGYVDGRSELGLALMIRGRIEEAEAELKQALRLRSDDWRARSNLASIYAETGRVADALREYAEAARQQPANPDLAGNYAAALLDAGRPDEARAIFQSLSAEAPGSAVGPNGLGALAAREGRWEEAAALFGEAARRDPSNVNAIYNQAQALARTGRIPQAIGVLERAAASGVADDAIVRLLNDLKAASRVPM